MHKGPGGVGMTGVFARETPPSLRLKSTCAIVALLQRLTGKSLTGYPRMIGTERLQRALHVIGSSQYVANGMGALSCNLISPSGGGKTELILSRLPVGAQVENDVTYLTLIHLMKQEKPPTYLVVPDLNMVISHKPAVAELTMAMLLALTGEGVTDLNPGLQNEVKIRMARTKKTGLRMGLITGITPTMFASKRGKWRSTGLLRRLIPLNYAYTKMTQNKIQRSIASGTGATDQLRYGHVKLTPSKRRPVEIPLPIAEQIRELSEQVTLQMQWRGKDRNTIQAIEYPFDPHKALRQMARSAAVLADRGTVTYDDYREVENIAAFMRLDHPVEL